MTSAFLVAPAPATAQSCTFEDGSVTLDVTGLPEPIMSVYGGQLDVRYAGATQSMACLSTTEGSANVTNTDFIRVYSFSPRVDLIINLGGEPFAPGETPEPDGTSEIEIQVDLSPSSDGSRQQIDVLIVRGTGGADRIATQKTAEQYSEGVNLNASEPEADLDLTGQSIEVLALEGKGGSDRLIGSSAFPGEVLVGGKGRDMLQGGSGFDVLLGQADNDRLNGGGGPDVLIGGSGKDRCVGGPGKDQLKTCE